MIPAANRRPKYRSLFRQRFYSLGPPQAKPSLLDTLANLSRDDTLFECARANIIVTGAGADDPLQAPTEALDRLLTTQDIDQINAFARAYGAPPPIVFFRGQMFELMRWVARHCRNLPGDGTTYADANTRRNFVKAALIAGMLWSYRIYGMRLKGDGSVQIRRNRAMGAFRKAMGESNFTPNLGRKSLVASGYSSPSTCRAVPNVRR